jgi:hypothetical protein
MDSDRIIELLIALGLGGVAVEVVRSFFLKKKMGADYADVISASAVRLLVPLENRIHELEREVVSYRNKLGEAVEEAERWKREAQAERMKWQMMAENERARFEDEGPHHHD